MDTLYNSEFKTNSVSTSMSSLFVDNAPYSPRKQELCIETDRINRILAESYRKIEMALCLPQLVAKPKELAEILGKEDARVILNACYRYRFTANRLDPFGQFGFPYTKSLTTAEDKNDTRLSKALDILSKSERFEEIVDQQVANVSPAAKVFLDYLKTFHNIGIERLNIGAPQEGEKQALLREAWIRNEGTKVLTVEYSKKLEIQRQEIEKALHEKEQILAQLQRVVDDINRKGYDDIKRTVQDSEENMVNIYKESQERQEELAEHARVAIMKYDTVLAQHLKDEQILRAKKTKVETQLLGWLAKYDADVGGRQQELDEVNAAYLSEKEEFESLQAKCRKQSKEHGDLMHEKDEAERKQMEIRMYMFLCHRAQRRIQKAWREYKQRKIDKKKAKKFDKSRKKGAKSAVEDKKSEKNETGVKIEKSESKETTSQVGKSESKGSSAHGEKSERKGSTAKSDSRKGSTAKADSRKGSTAKADSRKGSTAKADSRKGSTAKAESRKGSTAKADSRKGSTAKADRKGSTAKAAERLMVKEATENADEEVQEEEMNFEDTEDEDL